MSPLKASGPDGMLDNFFIDHWDTVGKDVVAAVTRFFETGEFAKEINQTFVVLIQKKIGANCFDYFRPISLCNFTYKIISKLLANQLRPLLKDLLSPFQSAFVLGRWIAENSIMVHEVLDSFKKLKGPEGEVFSRMLLAKEAEGLITGFKVSSRSPSITRLMYADDTVVFCKANIKDVGVVLECINEYGSWSGQQLNVQKFAYIFSGIMARDTQLEIVDRLGFRKLGTEDKFLGNPILWTKSKVKDFEFLKEKILSKIEGWRCKLLSQAGRATLIRTVAQSIPLYSMSSFLLPKWIGEGDEDRYLALVEWDALCLPVDQGMGNGILWAPTSGWFLVWQALYISLRGSQALSKIFLCGRMQLMGFFLLKWHTSLLYIKLRGNNSDEIWNRIWRLKITERMKLLPWKFGNRLQRIFGNPVNCALCGENVDSWLHLFCHCLLAKATWYGS
ncbi:uncharacterized protein LOC133039622 [Cannabis sativa]|uniref:uncharacterized protein LOC133039622 n=1 Tax=Cannabis sativa TaxID=3483 RepID=UPI0029CA9F0C|nr:uncharacterized protein LOC133039622 [Cannabis sativa]